ncbi:MAG: hypothetical protein ACLGH3_04090 [Actinomycetota bacterium]
MAWTPVDRQFEIQGIAEELIIVVEGGQIRETGTHEALIAEGGLYAELFTLQAAAYR